VETIAAALPAPGETASPELADGAAGLAVFYDYLSMCRRSAAEGAISARHLNCALREAGGTRLPAGLFSGVAGIAWAAQRIQRGHTPGAALGESPIDAALIAYAGRRPWRGDYDLIGGLVGLGVYAFERLPDPAGAALLERLIDRLAETAEQTKAGVTWPAPPERLDPVQRRALPARCYTLGVAHGVPGVIALLGIACGAGVAEEKARPILDGAVRWLLAQRLPPELGCAFGCWVEPGAGPRPSRSAWCYGDPGVAAALLLAAASVPDAWWRDQAVAVALSAATRPPERAGVRDAGLCHGAAGLGHLFNRMFQATGDPRMAEAARFWFRETLRLRRPGEGIGGFATYPGDPGEAGLLSGAAGAGLALLAAATTVEPAWDRVLLSAIPPRAGRAVLARGGRSHTPP
jgi:lantibiotic modifying enzyme